MVAERRIDPSGIFQNMSHQGVHHPPRYHLPGELVLRAAKQEAKDGGVRSTRMVRAISKHRRSSAESCAGHARAPLARKLMYRSRALADERESAHVSAEVDTRTYTCEREPILIHVNAYVNVSFASSG